MEGYSNYFYVVYTPTLSSSKQHNRPQWFWQQLVSTFFYIDPSLYLSKLMTLQGIKR